MNGQSGPLKMMEGDLKILEGYLTKEMECVPCLQLDDLLLVNDGL